MADQPLEPLGAEWWLDKLETELGNRQDAMQKMDAYYRGDHPMPFLTKAHNMKMRDEFRQLLEDSRANFMGLVVDVVEERLKVDGFRLSASTDATADQNTWRDIWQANSMDAEAPQAFIEALVKGVSYLSVWKTANDEYPTIAVEDPLQTIVGYEPGTSYRRRAAALKVWDDDWTGLRRANVFLPDGIYKFQATREANTPPASGYAAAYSGQKMDKPRWVPLATGEPEFVENPVGIVPIVPLRNRPRVLCEGESEICDVYRIQNQINGFLFLLALGGYFGAHKQRWATGLEIMVDETTGKPVEPFDVDIGKLWVAEPNEDGDSPRFGEFQQTDLAGYIKSIEQKVLHIAVISRTPRHYLFQEGQSPSGDAIESAESGLVKKVEKKQRPFGEGIEETLRLARRFAGDGASPPDSEIVWADAATQSPAVITDAVLKQYGGGLIPWEAALEKLGYTSTEIQRFSRMRLSDSLVAGIANPPPPAPDNVRPPTVRE